VSNFKFPFFGSKTVKLQLKVGWIAIAAVEPELVLVA
jgi:hypothetical protein